MTLIVAREAVAEAFSSVVIGSVILNILFASVRLSSNIIITLTLMFLTAIDGYPVS